MLSAGSTDRGGRNSHERNHCGPSLRTGSPTCRRRRLDGASKTRETHTQERGEARRPEMVSFATREGFERSHRASSTGLAQQWPSSVRGAHTDAQFWQKGFSPQVRVPNVARIPAHVRDKCGSCAALRASAMGRPLLQPRQFAKQSERCGHNHRQLQNAASRTQLSPRPQKPAERERRGTRRGKGSGRRRRGTRTTCALLFAVESRSTQELAEGRQETTTTTTTVAAASEVSQIVRDTKERKQISSEWQ